MRNWRNSKKHTVLRSDTNCCICEYTFNAAALHTTTHAWNKIWQLAWRKVEWIKSHAYQKMEQRAGENVWQDISAAPTSADLLKQMAISCHLPSWHIGVQCVSLESISFISLSWNKSFKAGNVTLKLIFHDSATKLGVVQRNTLYLGIYHIMHCDFYHPQIDLS